MDTTKQKEERIAEAADFHSHEMWGIYYDNTYDESCNILSYGEVTKKDFIAGATSEIAKQLAMEEAVNILSDLSEKRFEVIEILRTDAVRWTDILEVFSKHGIEFQKKEVPF